MRSIRTKMNWTFRTVEWSPKLLTITGNVNATHFILPDLPTLYSESDKKNYQDLVPVDKRIQTIAACHHDEKSLRETLASIEADKVLIVGGNGKLDFSSHCTLSTIDAAQITKNERQDLEIWGVTNPNDATSIQSVEMKIDSGISSFVTQPLLASHSLAILNSYPKNHKFIVGIAMPRQNKDLQFWLKLLNQPYLKNDPLFKSHMAYFQSPYFTSLGWVLRELLNLESFANIDGVHFMPINNIDDLELLL